MSSELEKLLEGHYIGEVVDSGHFTLDRKKALEKISAFQLPFPEGWVIKLVQGIALSDADRLDVHQTGTETTFKFDVEERFGADFESYFFDPGTHSDADFQAFRSGLWSVGIHLGRPFRLSTADGEYLWDGRQLSDLGTKGKPGRCLLEISHRAWKQGAGLPVLREIQAAQTNAAVLRALSLSVCAVGLQVKVDGLRLDGIHRYPEHGFSKTDLPLNLLWLWGRPEMAVPPGNRDNEFSYEGPPELACLCDGFQAKPTCHPAYAVALVSAHACQYQSRTGTNWGVQQRESLLLWVKDQVVVQREKFALPNCAVSLVLFVNADEIRTDITGFGLDEAESGELRLRAIRDLCRSLREWKPALSLVDKESHQKSLWRAGGIAAAGLGMSVVFPPAFLLAVGGVYQLTKLNQSPASLEQPLESGYQDLLHGMLQTLQRLEVMGSPG